MPKQSQTLIYTTFQGLAFHAGKDIVSARFNTKPSSSNSSIKTENMHLLIHLILLGIMVGLHGHFVTMIQIKPPMLHEVCKVVISALILHWTYEDLKGCLRFGMYVQANCLHERVTCCCFAATSSLHFWSTTFCNSVLTACISFPSWCHLHICTLDMLLDWLCSFFTTTMCTLLVCSRYTFNIEITEIFQ
jgi:hypothetical protein